MPARISISDRRLVVGVRSDLDPHSAPADVAVPLEHVVAAADGSAAAYEWLHRPGRACAQAPGACPGWYRWHDEWAYWDVRDPRRAIRIEVRDESFRRLVVEVEDPAATIARIGEACAATGAPSR